MDTDRGLQDAISRNVRVLMGVHDIRSQQDLAARLEWSPARAVYDLVNDYLTRIGVPYTFHNCRHRYGTQLYKITKDIRFVQKQMRHRSVASTEGYVAVPTDQAVGAVTKLDADLIARTRARRARRDLSA